MAHHWSFGIISGHQFVVTTFGIISMVRPNFVKGWDMMQVNYHGGVQYTSIKNMLLALEDATRMTIGQAVVTAAMTTELAMDVVITTMQTAELESG